jgi:hypothetical protein
MPISNSPTSKSARKLNRDPSCFPAPNCHERRLQRERLPDRPSRQQPTAGGRQLSRSLDMAELEREVAQLKTMVDTLVGLVNISELQACQRAAKITPDNATLKLWVGRSNSHPELASGPEERPW